ncbi:MAG: hypothetical protein M3461_01445 [Pseudomonadota bacterium]|nr:hypothetical protein [Pseudomonadota bacterium]
MTASEGRELRVREGGARRRLSGEPQRRQEPPHRVGLGHRAHDPARAGTARTDEDVNREHAGQGGR